MDLLCICLLLLHDFSIAAPRIKAAGKHNASAFHFTQTAAPKTSISVSHVRFESEGNLYICRAVCHVCIYFFNAYLDTEHTGGKGGRVISESSSEKMQSS